MSLLPAQGRAARCPALQEESRRLTTLIVLSSGWTPFVDLITIFDFCLSIHPQVGSVLALPASLNEAGKGSLYAVEGVGYDFTPDVLTREPNMIDAWVKTNDADAFAAVQSLMRHEAMLVGGSSGSALAGTLAWLRSESGREISQTPGKNVVIMLPDGCVQLFRRLSVLLCDMELTG
jgi:hypothetical protein